MKILFIWGFEATRHSFLGDLPADEFQTVASKRHN